MREADNKSWFIFLSVVGVYVVRTSSLNDKHSCQLFRKASSLVLLSSSVSTANLRCLLATTFSSLRFLFNFTSLQSFGSGQLVLYFLIFGSYPQSSTFFPLFFRPWSSVYSKFLISKWTFLFRHDKAALERSRNHGSHRSVFTAQKWLWACAWAT